MKYFNILLALCFLLCCYQCQSDQATEQSESNLSLEEELAALPSKQSDFEEATYKWGYMNRAGIIQIPARFDDVRDFQQGLAAVQFKGQWGFIDKKGNMVIEPQFKGVWAFQEGLARALTWEDKMGFINVVGKWVIPADYEQVQDFSGGLARVRLDGIYGYINKQGTLVIPTKFVQASNFENGLAKAKALKKYGLIDSTGNFIIEENYDKIDLPSAGLIRAKKDGVYGFLDKTGATIIPFQYKNATNFTEERAVVKKEAGYFLIDTKGEKQSSAYNSLWYGNEGIWIAENGKNFGAIDADGMQVIPFLYQQLLPLSEERTFYQSNQLWGIMDAMGNKISSAEFGLAWGHQEGLARVAFYEGIGFVDRNGNLQIPPKYLDVRDFSGGLARVQVQ
ncbi:MAG: WG repeat-containing protein [Bacteroidota bacterium]